MHTLLAGDGECGEGGFLQVDAPGGVVVVVVEGGGGLHHLQGRGVGLVLEEQF